MLYPELCKVTVKVAASIMNIMSEIMPDINITRRSATPHGGPGTLYSTLRKLIFFTRNENFFLFCKELKLSSSVGIQPVFSPWEG